MLSALGFLTVVGPARPFGRSTALWFPLVGAALGAVLGGIWWAGNELFGPAVAAALVLLADVALTGGLHYDGLADAADGLLPHADPPRRLEIMADPHVGAFALVTVPTILLVRWSALWTLPVEPLLLVGIWAMTRSFMAAAPAVLPYARPRGLATLLIAGAHWWIALAAIPAAICMAVAVGTCGLLAAAGTMFVMGATLLFAKVRIGGFTGDVLGAAAVLAETAGLVGAVQQ